VTTAFQCLHRGKTSAAKTPTLSTVKLNERTSSA